MNKNLADIEAKARFGTTVNCMDGRSVEATIIWMKRKFHLDYVDAITEPGMVALIGKMDEGAMIRLKRKLDISLMHHGSRTVTVVGHADCAGNPVDETKHENDVAQGVKVIRGLVREITGDESVQVVGLFINITSTNDVSERVIR